VAGRDNRSSLEPVRARQSPSDLGRKRKSLVKVTSGGQEWPELTKARQSSAGPTRTRQAGRVRTRQEWSESSRAQSKPTGARQRRSELDRTYQNPTGPASGRQSSSAAAVRVPQR
jgi:hypothetical protein